MITTWRVHPRPHGIMRLSEFLNRNLIAVGWGLMPDLSERPVAVLRSLHRKLYPTRASKIGRDLAQYDKLVNRMQPGDAIVLSGATGDEAYLGVIRGPYRHNTKLRDADDPRGERGFQHQRPVRWLINKRAIPVRDLPVELQQALHAQQPIVEVRGDHTRLFDRIGSKPNGKAIRRHRARPEAISHSQDEDDVYESLEGEPRLVVRLERSREAQFRAAKIRQVLARGNRICCDVPGCGFDFERRYGRLGAGFIHVHHRRALADFFGQRNLNGLMLVCPNCHAMIHRGGECRDPDTLIAHVRR